MQSGTIQTQVALLLLLVLLPIGVIGMVETWRAEVAISDLRRAAAAHAFERSLRPVETRLTLAHDVAETALRGLGDTDDPDCAGLSRILAAYPDLRLAGLQRVTGEVVCGAGGPRDAAGFVALPADSLGLTARSERFVLTVGIGNIATLAQDLTHIGARLETPSGQRLFPAEPGGAASGEPLRTFYRVPLVDGEVVALAPLPPPKGIPGLLASLALPLLIWAATFSLALYAHYINVKLPIEALQRRMNAFLESREITDPFPAPSAPRDLAAILAAFDAVAGEIVAEEAEMEDEVYERDVMLREVHHRVQNNLQLMSSIISMQIRRSEDADPGTILRSMKRRLKSLARYHRDLYHSDRQTGLRADTLLHDLAQQTFAVGEHSVRNLDVRFDMEELSVTPDQASSLALLATEALMNALARIPQNADACFVELKLKRHPDDASAAVFRVTSTARAGEPVDLRAIGASLVVAFASQLDASVVQEVRGDLYVTQADFKVDPPDGDDTDVDHGG